MYNLIFDPEDVYANRDGNLTPRQKKHVDSILHVRRANTRWTVIAFLIFIPSLIGFGILNEYQQVEESSLLAFLQTQLPLVCMLSGLFTITFGGSAIMNYAVSGSARLYRVSEAQGRAHIISITNEWRPRYSRYELHLRQHGLNRSIFRFGDPNALKYFKEGQAYRVYYVEYYPLPIVLSAEEIDGID